MLYFHFEHYTIFPLILLNISIYKTGIDFVKKKYEEKLCSPVLLVPFFSLERKINLFDIDMQSGYEGV